MAVVEALDDRVSPCMPKEDVLSMMDSVLENNSFSFNDKHYIQTEGTAIGSRLGMNYASTYLGAWEKKVLDTAEYTPYAYFRYVDDIWGVWTYGEEKLMTGFNRLFMGLVTSVLTGKDVRLNDYGGVLNFKCPSSRYVSRIESVHSNSEEDRKWNFECRSFPKGFRPERCSWSGYVDEFNETLDFVCRDNGYLAGARNYHGNPQFYCCSAPSIKYTDCYVANDANSMDEPMNYAVPRDHLIAGANSTHRDEQGDRIWKYMVCKFNKHSII
ncbi:hypothetical protein ScPMuIL_015595 [Solemya velum]